MQDVAGVEVGFSGGKYNLIVGLNLNQTIVPLCS